MLAKGFKKSTNPDVLVSIYAKSRRKIDVYSRRSYSSFYWYPSYYYGRDRLRITNYTEGTLFIDFIDTKQRKMIWQGIGSGALRFKTGPKKEERIQLFVKEILNHYQFTNEKEK